MSEPKHHSTILCPASRFKRRQQEAQASWIRLEWFAHFRPPHSVLNRRLPFPNNTCNRRKEAEWRRQSTLTPFIRRLSRINASYVPIRRMHVLPF